MSKRTVAVAVFVFLFAFLFLNSHPALGLNGRGYAFAPEPARSGVIHGVGAIMKKSTYKVSDGDTSHDEDLWRVVANAVYIGDTQEGSVLLTGALRFMDDKGNPDIAALKDMVIRFGPTVSSNQADRLILREEYRFLDGVTIKTAPGFISRANPAFSTAKRTNALALIFLPYHLEAPLKPIPIISKKTKLALESSYLAFGHGNKMDAGENPMATLSDYELDKTSGYLRWVPMTLKGLYGEQALLDIRPMPKNDQKVLFQSDSDNETHLVEGPCSSDTAAPLIISGNRIGKLEKDKVALPYMAMIGLGYGFAGTCQHPKDKVEPRTSFHDLRDSVYQDWIAAEVPKLPAN